MYTCQLQVSEREQGKEQGQEEDSVQESVRESVGPLVSTGDNIRTARCNSFLIRSRCILTSRSHRTAPTLVSMAQVRQSTSWSKRLLPAKAEVSVQEQEQGAAQILH